jgi:hypothetical protein
MTGKLKIKLDLNFGQPKRFLSTKVWDDWQVKNQLDLDFDQSKWFLSAKVCKLTVQNTKYQTWKKEK